MRKSLLLALTLLAAGCGSEPPNAPSNGRYDQGPLAISRAEVTIAHSQPPQVFLHVVGGGAPCTIVDPVTQRREGNLIVVSLETYWPTEFCILSLVQIGHTVALEGPFEPGEYLVRANGYEVRFRI